MHIRAPGGNAGGGRQGNRAHSYEETRSWVPLGPISEGGREPDTDHSGWAQWSSGRAKQGSREG